MKCDRCGMIHENPVNFREVIGNIMVPGEGGLVGQNIFTCEFEKKPKEHDQAWVEQKRLIAGKLPVIVDYGDLRVYSSIFCIPCFLKVCYLNNDNEGE